MDWDYLLAPYKQAVDELKIKWKAVRDQYAYTNEHSPIEFVTARVKPVASILDKAKRKGIAIDEIEKEMQDIAGIRIMCQFVDDISVVIELIRNRTDFTVVEEKDYVARKKDSGYRSYHFVVRYPVQTISGVKHILVEIQVRTLAMNFWATIEHSLNYKYSGQIPEQIQLRLQRAAEAAFRLDEEMSKIRDEVREPQVTFEQKKDQRHDSSRRRFP
ncbi:MAG TPA: GTP pyrophosphokinase family protein [Bacillales bacterium]|nr:GTP pyrophosphokinase family protein [Bacillales bacterium]